MYPRIYFGMKNWWDRCFMWFEGKLILLSSTCTHQCFLLYKQSNVLSTQNKKSIKKKKKNCHMISLDLCLGVCCIGFRNRKHCSKSAFIHQADLMSLLQLLILHIIELIFFLLIGRRWNKSLNNCSKRIDFMIKNIHIVE